METKSLADRINDASTRASQWLADGNEARESGNQAKADRCYDKAQFWHDRTNALIDKSYAKNVN